MPLPDSVSLQCDKCDYIRLRGTRLTIYGVITSALMRIYDVLTRYNAVHANTVTKGRNRSEEGCRVGRGSDLNWKFTGGSHLYNGMDASSNKETH